MTSPKDGAQTTIYLATADDVEAVNGAYFKNKKAISSRTKATNMGHAKSLWEISNQLCGTSF